MGNGCHHKVHIPKTGGGTIENSICPMDYRYVKPLIVNNWLITPSSRGQNVHGFFKFLHDSCPLGRKKGLSFALFLLKASHSESICYRANVLTSDGGRVNHWTTLMSVRHPTHITARHLQLRAQYVLSKPVALDMVLVAAYV